VQPNSDQEGASAASQRPLCLLGLLTLEPLGLGILPTTDTSPYVPISLASLPGSQQSGHTTSMGGKKTSHDKLWKSLGGGVITKIRIFSCQHGGSMRGEHHGWCGSAHRKAIRLTMTISTQSSAMRNLHAAFVVGPTEVLPTLP